MKKLLALVLVLSMSLALVACGEKKADETEKAPETPAEFLAAEFKELSEEGDYTALAMAEALCAAEIIPIGPMAMEIEPGFLTGFDNAEITEFEEGALFAPMIGTIPFIGYVFTLADDADAEAFVKTLEESANLRWNICTAADEMVSEVSGNQVLFVMSPASFEE